MKNVAKIIIPIVLILAIGLLLLSVSKPPTLKTVPVSPVPIVFEPDQPSPRAPDETPLEQPTPRAPEVTPKPSGIPAESVFPQEINFWVNNIFVPFNSDFEGGRFIRIEDDDIKTFAGSFGRYEEDPRAHLRVELCAELSKGVGAVSCENIALVFRDRYVSFAKGYQFDEYIGGSAAKDYYAFYTVYVGDIKVAESNHAVIRTVKST